MASLAPGNGWFPNRSHDYRKFPVAARNGSAGNVYAFPPIRPAARNGRISTRVFGWWAFGLVLGTLAWLGVMAGLLAAAIVAGVPWVTAAAVFSAVHVLAACCATMVVVRIGRTLIPGETFQRIRETR